MRAPRSGHLGFQGRPCSLVFVVTSARKYSLMRKLALGFMLVVVWGSAQTYQDLLLPESLHIVGVVVDPDGRTVVGASVDHSGDRRQVHQSDSDGRFVLDTRAPALVVRKAGYQSELIHTQNATEVRVALRKLTQSRIMPVCVNGGRYVGIEGWRALLQFPRVPGVKVSEQGNDIDFGIRFYSVKTSKGHKGIRHGSGPFWSRGTPSDMDVWRTITYEETTLVAGGQTVTDARGQLANGSRWRFLGRAGESADYSDVDQATAKILDQILDGACLSSSAASPTRH